MSRKSWKCNVWQSKFENKIKKSQTIKIKNLVDEFDKRLDILEERICELYDIGQKVII